MKMYSKKCVSAFLTAAMLLSAAISAPMTASAFEIGKNPAYAARNDILSDSSSNNNGDVLANYNVGKNGKTNIY